MNLLVVSSISRYAGIEVGGAETSLQLIAEKFAQLGEHVVFLTHRRSFIPGCTRQHITPMLLTQQPNPMDESNRKPAGGMEKSGNGIDVYFLTCFRWPYLKGWLFPEQGEQFRTYQRRRWIAHIVKSRNIDLIHTYDTINDTADVLKAREIYHLKIKVVKRVAGLFWAHQLNLGMVSREKVEWVFNSVDAVNFLTARQRDLVYQTAQDHNIHLHPKKEMILDIGINLDLFHYQALERKDHVFKIVCVTRFAAYQKRPELLIEALQRIGNPNIVVEFVGIGDSLEYCRHLTQKLNLNDRVTFHGYVAQKELIKIVSASDLFALPTKYEGMPKAMLEAMALKIPCLVSDIVPMNAYVQDGQNGFLAQNFPEHWARKIEEIYLNRHRLPEIVQKGWEFVSQNYDANQNILKYRQQFQELLACSLPKIV